jgi:hypothetical protein
MRPMPPFPPAQLWASWTQEQKDAFWAECRAVERHATRFLLAWQLLMVATLAAGVVAMFVMVIPMLEIVTRQ